VTIPCGQLDNISGIAYQVISLARRYLRLRVADDLEVGEPIRHCDWRDAAGGRHGNIDDPHAGW
jgi:hypothetical protein